jgi:hypothetical protein
MRRLRLALLLLLPVTAGEPPARRVDVSPSGGFRVDNEPFFPVGFYYIWQAVRGEGDTADRMAMGGGNGRPPRTDKATNRSKWATAEHFWKDYYEAGFNTFTVGWMGSTWLGGYGQMLTYLQEGLGTGIMPILNVGNTQQVYNAHPKQKPPPSPPPPPPLPFYLRQRHLLQGGSRAPPSPGAIEAKAEAAGAMAKTFSNASILAYYIFDEVGPGSMPLDTAVSDAVRGNDSFHRTFSLVCGVQCSGFSHSLNARLYAERHEVSAVDSYTQYQRNVTISPTFIVQDVEMAKAAAPPGQPLIAVLQAVVPFIQDCRPGNEHRLVGCEQYRPILPAEARCEAFLAIAHGATGLLYFDWGPAGDTPQNTSISFLIDDMQETWAMLQSIATEVRDVLAPAIVDGRPPPFAKQITATGSDHQPGSGPYSTWVHLDISVWQTQVDTLVLIVVNTLPRSLKSVVIDLTALTETLLSPNASVQVDVSRQAGGDPYNLTMQEYRIQDKNFTGAYSAHTYTIKL